MTDRTEGDPSLPDPPGEPDADIPDWDGDVGELVDAPGRVDVVRDTPDDGGGRLGAGSVVVLVLIGLVIGGFVTWALVARGPKPDPSERLAEASRPVPKGPPPSELAEGAALYDANCAQCHGANGDGSSAPSLRTRGLGPGSIGDEILVGFVQNGGGQMAGFAGRLTTEQTAAIVDYLRWLQGFGPGTPPPGPDD